VKEVLIQRDFSRFFHKTYPAPAHEAANFTRHSENAMGV